jgi:hypothetical protein
MRFRNSPWRDKLHLHCRVVKWIPQLVAAVILAEGIGGLLSSLTSNLLVPLLARAIEVDPRSPSPLGKGELNVARCSTRF